MTSRQIRRQFLDFFAARGHKIIPSAPIVAKNDPTLMFVNSGMAPLKDYFLGHQTPPAPRVANTQKCLRVTGKHNDLEDVGRDGYHHTMFEMLGNWSFGDYFKKEAIAWSWELLTEVYRLPKDRLYVTVFKGDAAENLPFDEEARAEWLKYLPEDRILAFGKKENFWEMGDQGPCGPCSEIHIDLRPPAERAQKDARELVNADDPNVIEIWNNVFMQFNRRADGTLEELPAKSVDTGMGFERLCRAIQGVASNYDTDLWRPLFDFLEKYTGIRYEGTYPGLHTSWKMSDIAMRVVADHLRAVCFTIADGELPSNTGAGYVIRRILRRAVRYYYSFLSQKEPLLYRIAPILAEEFSDVFPELKAQIDFVVRVILEEEKAFLRTLESGLRRIEALHIKDNVLDGRQAFELYDTFGFPIDLTRLIAREKGWSVDEAGFEKALQEQKERSRKDAAKEVGDWVILREESDPVFVGYDLLEVNDAYVIKYRTVQVKGKPQYHVVLNRTPFYPEGGGQVGDTGWMYFGEEEIRVLDTKKENDLIIHFLEHIPASIEVPAVRAVVEARRRQLIENNHSATHLLHAALRRVLGQHVQQKGSYLDDQILRFDFSHFQKVTEEELAQIEQLVNEKIRENIPLEEARNIPIEEAQKAGAMMLFGEKYGERVRMITFDPAYSRELCGGCHVKQTGRIGFFKIISESAIAAGVRRIEALTASAAERYVATLEREVAAIRALLKAQEPARAVAELQEENKRLHKEIERLLLQQASQLRERLLQQVERHNGFSILVAVVPLSDANIVKTLAHELERELGVAVVALGSISGEKPLLTVRISETLVKERGLHAGNIAREIAQKYLRGGGGGQPSFATAGGTDASRLLEAVQAVKALLT
ncbi:MAG: alanine--tRNA ligase [Saprospiraceae bacterium]|nr:alanine--tRNA ligase [Saprospiraceae bacterium]MDW8485117.1 alanine--tRNA ligase [Saprospiraceae bacterium]